MLDKVLDIVKGAFTPSVYSVAAIALAAAPVAVMLLIAIFGGGEARKIRAGFRRVIRAAKKGDSPSDEAMNMPLHVRSAVENSKKSGVLPGELMPEHNCVFVPCAYSQKNNLGILTSFATLLCAMIAFFLGRAIGAQDSTVYCATLLTLAVGAVGSIIGSLVAISFKLRTKRIFRRAVAVLDAETRNGAEAEAETVAVESVPDFSPESSEPVRLDEPEFAADESKDEYSEAYDYETESDFAVGEEPQKEDIIARVEQIAVYGASIEEMKEVAALLRLERMKPENRTPSKKKRLDDAFASLLRSVGSARK